MIAHLKSRVVLALAVLFSSVVATHAGSGAIRDNAAFFSAQAKTEALKTIHEMSQRYHKELVVETFAEIPADLRQGVDLTNKAAMARLYEQWAVKLAKQEAVNGVYVLLVKQPAHLQVLVGNDTQKMAFTLADRDALTNLMLTQLRSKHYDQALLEGVGFVQSTLRAHLPERGRTSAIHTTRTSSSNHWILGLVLGLLALWVVMRILGAIFGGGNRGAVYGGGGYPGGVYPGGGGGGFMSNMLGGMFGAAAGMWIYDQFSGRSSSSSSWGGGGDLDNRGDSGFSGQDSDYSGSGGDFGAEDSGGSDFGGGGDSGGDDSSGGGGF